jgi:hypothetical protein
LTVQHGVRGDFDDENCRVERRAVSGRSVSNGASCGSNLLLQWVILPDLERQGAEAASGMSPQIAGSSPRRKQAGRKSRKRRMFQQEIEGAERARGGRTVYGVSLTKGKLKEGHSKRKKR